MIALGVFAEMGAKTARHVVMDGKGLNIVFLEETSYHATAMG